MWSVLQQGWYSLPLVSVLTCYLLLKSEYNLKKKNFGKYQTSLETNCVSFVNSVFFLFFFSGRVLEQVLFCVHNLCKFWTMSTNIISKIMNWFCWNLLQQQLVAKYQLGWKMRTYYIKVRVCFNLIWMLFNSIICHNLNIGISCRMALFTISLSLPYWCH